MASDLLNVVAKSRGNGAAPTGEGTVAGAAGQAVRVHSKDEVIAVHRSLLGTVPDSEVARLAGVCVRTVATYRSRMGIPGYAGARRPPPKRDGKRSMLDPLRDLVGQVPDRVVAEAAGMSIGAVRAFRVARGIEASTTRARAESRPVVGAWQTPAGKPAGTVLGAWQVCINDGSSGIVFAVNAKAAIEQACGHDRAVVAIEYLGDLMAPVSGAI